LPRFTYGLTNWGAISFTSCPNEAAAAPSGASSPQASIRPPSAQASEKLHHLLAPQLLAQNHLLGGVHPMKLENMLRRIHSNSANLFHGRSPLSEICNDLILAQSMPSGAVHTNRHHRSR
jgi:hypothetical protein